MPNQDDTANELEQLRIRVRELEAENKRLKKQIYEATPSHIHQRKQLLKAIVWFIDKYGSYPTYEDVFETVPSRSKAALRGAIDNAAMRGDIELVNPVYQDATVKAGKPKVITSSRRHLYRQDIVIEKIPMYEMRREFALLKAKWKNRRKRSEKLGIPADDPISVMYHAQDGKCWWCSVELNNQYVIDHRVPLARRGTNDIGNLCLTCGECNKKKSAKTPHRFNGRLL